MAGVGRPKSVPPGLSFLSRVSTKGPWALVRGRSPHDPWLDSDGVSTFSVSYAAVGCCRDRRRHVMHNHELVGKVC